MQIGVTERGHRLLEVILAEMGQAGQIVAPVRQPIQPQWIEAPRRIDVGRSKLRSRR